MGQLGFWHTLLLRLAMWAAKSASKSCNGVDLRLRGRLFHALATLYVGKWRPAITDGFGSLRLFSELLLCLASGLFSTGSRKFDIG